MRNTSRNLLKVAMALFLIVLMSFPVQGTLWMDKDVQIIDTDPEVKKDNEEGLRELSEEEVDGLIRSFGSDPTRSEPWLTWERFSYHRSGEDGLIAYHDAENRVFIYGGGSASWSSQSDYWRYNAVDDLFIFDFDDNKWYALERYYSPGGRFGFSYVVDEANERFIIYGGFSGSMLDDLWEFDMNTLEWNQITSTVFGSIYLRRGYAPMVLDTTGGVEHLYIHMGMNDDTYSYYVDNLTGFYRVDLENPTSPPTALADGWNSGTGGLVPRFHHSMTIDESGRKIYMFGGQHMPGDTYVSLDDFWMYDIISNIWTELTTHVDMPLNYGAKIFYRPSDDRVYLWGGRETSSSALENTTLWIYDTTIQSWDRYDYNSPNTDVPSGRLLYHHHYSATSDKFYVFGGRYYYPYGSGTRSSRYRDLSYLTMSSKVWDLFPTISNPSTRSDGIFAYESSQNRLHYIGPNSDYTGIYTWYWDLTQEKWYGPHYNTGTEDPPSRSNAGMCYDEKNNTVYMYGGGYTTGSGMNRRYYDRADMWKLDLDTYEWEKIWDTAGPGLRQGFDMVWNDNDGRVYFYGGRFHPTTGSETTGYGEFYTYIPSQSGGIFQQISPVSGSTPGVRYGAGTVFVSELNKLYLTSGRDPNPSSVKNYRDLWEFDFGSRIWTELDSLTSPRVSPKLDYDPLTKELYMTGGDDYVIYRYRILEDNWYNMDPDVNPGSMSGQAHIFIPETRDLWVYGGGVKDGIWKIGMPYRLAIQSIYFEDPENGADRAYSMLRPYTFGTVIKTVNGPADLANVQMSLLHRKGTFKVIYNYTNDEWLEVDIGDYAEITSSSATWDGNFVTLEVSVKFHWNFSSKNNAYDKKVSVNTNGIGVSPDYLEVRSFLHVMNGLEIIDPLSFEGEVQGDLKRGGWARTSEPLNITGPYVRYAGTIDVFPPTDSYVFMLSEGQYTPNNDNILLTDVYRTWEVDMTPGEPMEFNIIAPNRTYSNVSYVLNMTGVNKEDQLLNELFWISTDGVAPSAPTSTVLHADAPDDTHTNFDNDLEVYLTWMGSGVSESGIFSHYWSLEDKSGTRDGTPVVGGEATILLPSNGTHTVYVWTEDNVGNIGGAGSASITIDTEMPVFTIISPDLDQMIPYQQIDIVVNVTDFGGSLLNSLTLQYRFTDDGQNSEDLWTGTNAWKDLSDLWTDFPKESMQFTLTLGANGILKLSDSEENFLQFRIVDHAGNEVESDPYNIRVDTNLRFPMVTLYGPEEGEMFEDVDDILLNWTLDFFLADDVVYRLYIERGEEGMNKVLTLDPSIMIELVDMEYVPKFVDHGTWYWIVIPVARGQWAGNSTNGVKSFSFSNEASYSFEVTTSEDRLIRAKGTTGIPISFEITNSGQNIAVVNLAADLDGVGTLDWVGGDSIDIQVGDTKGRNALLSIFESTPVGDYTLTFYFNSTDGVQREVQITLVVKQAAEDPDKDPDNGNDPTMYLIMGAVVVVLLLLIIAVIYFMVIKKGEKKKDTSQEDIDKLEEELSDAETSAVTAPQPKGIHSRSVTKGSVRPSESEGEIEGLKGIPELEEETQLVEEGADDDWMNLVASETLALEHETYVEEDKAHHDEPSKSLGDLLSEMSEGVEDE